MTAPAAGPSVMVDPASPTASKDADGPDEAGAAAIAGPTYALPASTLTFAAPSAALAKKLAPVSKGVGGMPVTSAVRAVSASKKPVGAVAVLTLAGTMAGSATFREQYAGQLVATLRSSGKPRYVMFRGTTVALSASGDVAAWFEANRAIVLVCDPARSAQPLLTQFVGLVSSSWSVR